MDMDGWIWVDGHMGEHFKGTGEGGTIENRMFLLGLERT